MKISIVTPSYNQGRFLEAALHSVLTQGATNLEYIVIDGGSTDGSVETIRSIADQLAYWHSKPDRGHMDGLNQGFARSTGEIMGWINSDDMLTPWALRTIESIFASFPQVEWLTTLYPLSMTDTGVVNSLRRTDGFEAESFYRGRNVPIQPQYYSSLIQQESTFWRRSLWDRAGARMDEELRVAGDFELWSRFFEHAELFGVAVPLGCFRRQASSFTATEFDAYLSVCRRVLKRCGRPLASAAEGKVRRAMRNLPERLLRASGLARPVWHIVRGNDPDGRVWSLERHWIV